MELFVTTLYGLQNTSIRATAQFCLAEMLQPQNSQAGSQAVTVTCAGMAAGFTLEEILNGVVQTMAFCKFAHKKCVLTWKVNALMAFAPMTSPF